MIISPKFRTVLSCCEPLSLVAFNRSMCSLRASSSWLMMLLRLPQWCCVSCYSDELSLSACCCDSWLLSLYILTSICCVCVTSCSGNWTVVYFIISHVSSLYSFTSHQSFILSPFCMYIHAKGYILWRIVHSATAYCTPLYMFLL